MIPLTAATVFALAAQWGQPVAPKPIVAEAAVESGLDPLAIHDNTTGRTFRPSTMEEALQIAMQLDAAGGNYDVAHEVQEKFSEEALGSPLLMQSLCAQ